MAKTPPFLQADVPRATPGQGEHAVESLLPGAQHREDRALRVARTAACAGHQGPVGSISTTQPTPCTFDRPIDVQHPSLNSARGLKHGLVRAHKRKQARMPKPILFLGSSSAARSQAKAFASAFSDDAVEFLPWWEAFTPGRTLLSELDEFVVLLDELEAAFRSADLHRLGKVALRSGDIHQRHRQCHHRFTGASSSTVVSTGQSGHCGRQDRWGKHK